MKAQLTAKLFALLTIGIGGALLSFRLPPGPRADWFLNGGLALWGLGTVGVLVYQRHADEALRRAVSTRPRPYETTPTTSVQVIRLEPLRRRWLAVGVGLMTLLTLQNLFALGWVNLTIQFAVLVAVIVTVGGGFGPLRPPRVNWRVHWPLIPILMLAFGLRAYDLSYVRTWVDEAHFVSAVVALWDGSPFGLLRPMARISAFSSMYIYLQSLATAVFGTGFVGFRAPSVMFGTLTVGAVYWLAWEVALSSDGGRGSPPSQSRLRHAHVVSIVAALLLATLPPHIHFSRSALNNIADPLFGVTGAALLVRGARTGSTSTYVWAGLAFGMGHYFYEVGRLLFTAVLLFAPLWLRGLHRRGYGLAIGAMALLGVPILLGTSLSLGTATPRLTIQAVTRDYWLQRLMSSQGFYQINTVLNERFGPNLRHFVHLWDQNGAYYGRQVLLPWLVPLFLLGVSLSVAGWRRNRLLPALIVLLTILGNGLITTPALPTRFVVSFPFLALAMAWALLFVWRRGALLLAVLLAISQVGYYFGVHLPQYHSYVRGSNEDYSDIAYHAAYRDLPDDMPIVVAFTNLVDTAVLQDLFKTVGRDPVISYVTWYDWPTEPTPEQVIPIELLEIEGPVAYFVAWDAAEGRALIEETWGVEPQYTPFNVPREVSYVLYVVP